LDLIRNKDADTKVMKQKRLGDKVFKKKVQLLTQVNEYESDSEPE
jgi:hypothetical protein